MAAETAARASAMSCMAGNDAESRFSAFMAASAADSFLVKDAVSAYVAEAITVTVIAVALRCALCGRDCGCTYGSVCDCVPSDLVEVRNRRFKKRVNCAEGTYAFKRYRHVSKNGISSCKTCRVRWKDG